MKPCIFCSNPRTKKSGEHVWDDWLNREHGKVIVDHSKTSYFGHDGQFIRSHPSVGMHVTVPVVCDPCNNDWMSELSTLAKALLEPVIRNAEPTDFTDFDHIGLATIAAFAFMKAAVLDWSVDEQRRKPIISRTSCLAFRAGILADPLSLSFPDGLQVWIASYRRTQKMEAITFIEDLIGARYIKGYRILLITYVVGTFIFQLTCPRWTKATRNRQPPPFLEIVGDNFSVPIWPGVIKARWPPPGYINYGGLEAFRERFRRIRFY